MRGGAWIHNSRNMIRHSEEEEMRGKCVSDEERKDGYLEEEQLNERQAQKI